MWAGTTSANILDKPGSILIADKYRKIKLPVEF
jgi:hypothetical protein